MKKRIRKSYKERKKEIMDAAIEIAIENGFNAVTRSDISKRLKISKTLIPYYLGPTKDLRTAILKEALKREILIIAMQAISINPPLLKKLNSEIKSKILKYVKNFK